MLGPLTLGSTPWEPLKQILQLNLLITMLNMAAFAAKGPKEIMHRSLMASPASRPSPSQPTNQISKHHTWRRCLDISKSLAVTLSETL